MLLEYRVRGEDMNVRNIAESLGLEVINQGSGMDTSVSSVECCDLLSIAMGNLPPECAWVTVMSNINTLAVASLTDAACVILALNTQVTDEFTGKAAETGITVLRSEDGIFETALAVHDLICRE